jgi:hypothetical protein
LVATGLVTLDVLVASILKAQRSLHQEPHRARETRPATARSPTLAPPRTSGSDLPGAELGRCNGHLNQDLPACGGAEGVAGPIPGALGNRDLVVVVGVAPVNLAGLNIGDPVPGRGYGHPSRECRSEAITPATRGTNPAEVAPKRSERHTGALAFKHFAVSGNLIPSGWSSCAH